MATFSADFATERATYTVGGSRNKDDAISKIQTLGPSSDRTLSIQAWRSSPVSIRQNARTRLAIL